MDLGQTVYLVMVTAGFSIFGSVLAVVHAYERRGTSDFETPEASPPVGEPNKIEVAHKLAA